MRAATAKKGTPRAPKVSLLELEAVCDAEASTSDRQQVASLLGLPEDQVPPVQLTWGHVHKTPQGALLGSCPKVPSDLEAKIGYHVDTKDPSQKEQVFGSCHLTTTDLNRELGLELPLGTTTAAADAHEGHEFIAHREALAMPMVPGQVHLGDAAHDGIDNYRWLHDHGGIAVFDDNRRNEHLDPEALRQRGYAHNGTP